MQPERELTISSALKQVLVPLTLCLIFDLGAGIFLGISFEKLLTTYPEILIVIPGLMGLRGNVFGSLGSRISTSLYLGSSDPSIRDEYISKNVFFSIWAATVPALILFMIAAIKFFGKEGLTTTFQIILDSSVMISAILGIFTAIIVIESFRRGLDPDNIMGPAVTTFADLVSIPSIVLFIFIFERYAAAWVSTMILAVILTVSIYLSVRGGYDKKAYKEVLMIVSLLALIQSVTGNILQEFSEIIHRAVFLSFAYPAVIGSIGNYGSIMVARTSTKLHLGELPSRKFVDAVYIFPTSLIIAPIIFILAFFSASIFAGMALPELKDFLYFLAVYLALTAFVLLFSTALSIWLHRMGVDPDNGGIPLTTTLTDIIGTLSVVILAYLIA
ncbi:MAG: magnesium transporter [Archaeoglobus sp.]|uniref:magnesium transporter n=1 Tax=Archaeoglobus sp. TaxID=1872626 RepID=UPI001DFFC9A9|nr:magnesium transporter [Archaeoglobus sp.]MBO8180554.1 magnesium transporter [Archaeoglobus sp.]